MTKARRAKSKTFLRRNYRVEYQRRVQLGLLKGLSRSQARGHARAGERPKPPGPVVVNPKSKEEVAIGMIKAGAASLRESARLTGQSEQHLRRYIKENVGAVRVGKRWIINDRRPRPFPIYSEAQLKTVILALEQASRAALFMHAVRQFLPSGDIEILAPYVGQGVTDV